jgi:hypothetical protein
MDNHFENNIEEINQIIGRSKKDKSTTIFRIQKSKRLHVNQRDNEVVGCHIDTLEGVNMHMLSDDGHLIYGASDRMHLPDVITRLYQSLDNLLKANKGHKVRSEIKAATLPTEVFAKLQYLDLVEWSVEYYQNLLAQIYMDASDEVKENASLSFHIEGSHSLWLIANSEGGQSEFDDFSMTLTWKMSLKSNPWKSITVTKILPIEALRAQNIDTAEICSTINDQFKLLNNSYKKIEAQKVSPEAIALYGELSNVFFYNVLCSTSPEILTKQYAIKDNVESGLISELVCKYGAELSSSIDITHPTPLSANTSYFEYTEEDVEAETRISRQYSFYDQVIPHFRNLALKPKKTNDSHITVSFDSLEADIEKIKKAHGVSKLLLLSGLRSDQIDQLNNWDCLSPVIALYSDEKGIYSVDISHISIPELHEAQVQFDGKVNQTVFRLESQLPFTVETGDVCIIKSSKKVNVA